MLKVAAAATLEPEMAPNTPFAATTTEARPPGSQPSHLSSAENRRCTAPLPEKTAPMKTKSGMARSVNELSDSQAVHAICTSGLSTTNTSPNAAVSPIAAPISSPKASSTRSPPMSSVVLSSGLKLELLGLEFVGVAARLQVLHHLDQVHEQDQGEQREPDGQRHLRPFERRHQHGIGAHVAREGIGEELPAHPRGHGDERKAERERDQADPPCGARPEALDDERNANVVLVARAVGEAEERDRHQGIAAELVGEDQRLVEHVARHHLRHGEHDDAHQEDRRQSARRVRELPDQPLRLAPHALTSPCP